jgi:hypothetical protein
MFLYKNGITSLDSRLVKISPSGSCSGILLPLLIHLIKCAVSGTTSVTSKLDSACRSQLSQPPLFGSDAKIPLTPARLGSLDQSSGFWQKSPMKMKIWKEQRRANLDKTLVSFIWEDMREEKRLLLNGYISIPLPETSVIKKAMEMTIVGVQWIWRWIVWCA